MASLSSCRHGPAKSPKEEGLDEELLGLKLDESKARPDRGPNYSADPLGKRTGEAPDPAAAETLNRALQEVSRAQSMICGTVQKPYSV